MLGDANVLEAFGHGEREHNNLGVRIKFFWKFQSHRMENDRFLHNFQKIYRGSICVIPRILLPRPTRSKNSQNRCKVKNKFKLYLIQQCIDM